MNRLEVRDLPRLPKRRPDAHKGDFGHVFIIAGSRGMAGAGCLAAMGALRSGAGLVTVGCPESLYPIMAGKLTEAMTLPLPETSGGALAERALEPALKFAEKCTVVAVGPGLGQGEETAAFVRGLAERVDHVLIVDADGLNAFSGRAKDFAGRKGPTLITPHPGEMGRLVGKTAAEVQMNREGVAAEFAARFEAFAVLLKGAGTLVAEKDRLFVNATGNPGMATGGSGDVLTGVSAALVGQRLDHFEAGALGAHIHGLAGDLAARRFGQISMIAGDLVESLPAAFENYRTTSVLPARRPANRKPE
ncbi:MAG TPA: NAD(P)H-hydrate dehydratase [Planctomycetota bacterium]|nr:NAD(P)H-hydrate dehydratase [Planctomycetota bacterium]